MAKIDEVKELLDLALEEQQRLWRESAEAMTAEEVKRICAERDSHQEYVNTLLEDYWTLKGLMPPKQL